MKRSWKHKGKFLCYHCYHKRFKNFLGGMKPYYNLEEALSKVYIIRGYAGKQGVKAVISIPSILAGHKVKLVLADEN